jgi:LuxR family maltose regulon positive regulatory protein
MSNRTQAIVQNNLLLTNDAEIQVGSRRWHAWLADHPVFTFQGNAGHLTARREMRRGSPYWYGYRWRGGKLCKTYLGKAVELTQERLERACARLAGQTARTRLSPEFDSAAWMVALNQSPTAATASSERTEPGLSYLPLTKIRPPALPQRLVARPRLTQRINAPITLLIAPSGFGKSTLLNEWRQTCGMPVAWVSLDAGDNQPLRFWSTVTAALQTVYPNLGQDPQSPLRTPSFADLGEIVVGLTNVIVRAGDAPDSSLRLGLVLDDWHHIHDQEIHASLQNWLEHLPPTLQLVISSHTKPSLALGHLRARGMVAELDAEDLRFTSEEGIGYLSQHARGHSLAYSDMQAIMKRTEGWIAGLALAILALDQPGDRHQTLATFTGAHTYLREYFIENIVYRQPPSVQEFLLETAILKHLTGPLCNAVTGRSDGEEMLSYLWRENLFLVRLEAPGWYRYHDLFAETLCNQLQRQLTAGIPRLHRRAAEWYRTQNAPDDAVYHLLAIEAWEEAASLIEDIVLHELEQFGDYSRLLRWLRQLPETVVQRHRTLLRVYVRVAAMDLSRIEVKQILTRVETNITRKPIAEQTADEQSVLAEIQRIRQIWMEGETGLAPLSRTGEHDDVWQMLDGIVTYARYIRRDSEKAETVARELYEMARARSHLYVMLIAAGGLVYYLILRGHLRRAERIAREVLQQAMAQRGKLPESASVSLTMLSRVCYERNQLAQAHQLLLRAAEVDPNPTSSNMPIMEAMQRAKIEFAQGDAAAAMATLQAARELQAKYPSGLYRDRDLLTYQAWFCIRQGDCAGAERLLSEVGENEPHAFAALVRAQLLLEQEQAAAATDILRDLTSQYPQGLYLEPILGARILLACALFEQHQVNHARQVMADVIRFACPEGFLRPFLDYGRSSAPLLTLVLHTSNLTSDAQSFIKQLLRLLASTEGAQKPVPKAELAALSAAASITAREQQVLRLVSMGLSNHEIAAQLSFAESTVKSHLKNIYRKLAVNSRTRAIAQARALKLA